MPGHSKFFVTITLIIIVFHCECNDNISYNLGRVFYIPGIYITITKPHNHPGR